MEKGERIWIESVLTKEEYKNYGRKYPAICSGIAPAEFDCEFKWRKGMGASLPSDQIDLINGRLDELKKRVITHANSI